MKRLTAASLGVLLAAVSLPAANSEEIIVADYRISWDKRIAFYEPAPPALRDAMRKAVHTEISSDTSWCDEYSETQWLCENPGYRVFRGVAGDGSETRSGFACFDYDGFPDIKYLPVTFAEGTQCVGLDWDDDEQTYDVYDMS